VNRDDYVVGHVRDALAHDGETDVHAAVVNGRLVLTGNVVTPSRRDLVARLASEAADGMEVVVQLDVLDHPSPSATEELA
jgi:osmotically-inducible protein OsmY